MYCKPITKLTKLEYPKYFIVFDTESYIHLNTHHERHEFRLGVAIYIELDDNCQVASKEIYHYNNIDSFWNYVDHIAKKDKLLWIFAHNCKYDGMNLKIDTKLFECGWTCRYPIMNHAFILSAHKGKKRIKFVDTFNYVKGSKLSSVEGIGKSLGNSKTRVNFLDVSNSELAEYCQNDCEIIVQFMLNLIQFLKTNSLGSLKNTLASCAFDVYRHSFIDHPIYCHTHDKLLSLERAGYKGGMVECYHLSFIPRDRYFLLDVNSMYPYVMANFKLPVRPLIYVENPDREDFNEWMKNDYVIAEVILNIKDDNTWYAVKHDGKLLFPNGEFKVTLHYEEIREAIKRGYLKKINVCAVYQANYCLKKYALYFYDYKKNAKTDIEYQISKLFMNSLYGRLGMRHYEMDVLEFGEALPNSDSSELPQFITMDVLEEDKENLIKGVFYRWGNDYIRSHATDFLHTSNTNIALAGAVTAIARMTLCKYRELAGYQNCFYSDTDSLVVNEKGYRNLLSSIDDKELGKLKVEYEFNSGRIRAPKHYTLTNKHKLRITGRWQGRGAMLLLFKHKSIIIDIRRRSKGVPINAVRSPSGKLEYWRFVTFKDHLRGKELGRIKVEKENTFTYSKGNCLAGRGRVSPYQMRINQWSYNEIVK